MIDTNVLIEYAANLLPEEAHSYVSGIIDAEFSISVINKIEALGYSNVSKDFEKVTGESLWDLLENSR